MAYVNNTACCGVGDINGISYGPPQKVLVDVVDLYSRFAHYLFTAVVSKRDQYGPQFRDYLLTHNLGTVVETGKKKNPNSGRMIVAYLWTPNWPRLRVHMKGLK